MPGIPTTYSNWTLKARERQYMYLNGGGTTEPTWNTDAIGWWMKHAESLLSSRDPLNLGTRQNCQNIAYIEGLTEPQCSTNPFPEVPLVPGINRSGYYDASRRCWVAVEGKGWQNLECVPNSLPHQYLGIPLMYPITQVPLTEAGGVASPAPPLSLPVTGGVYDRSIKYQAPLWSTRRWENWATVTK